MPDGEPEERTVKIAVEADTTEARSALDALTESIRRAREEAEGLADALDRIGDRKIKA